MKKSEIAFSVLLIPLDFFALLLAFYISFYVRNSITVISPDLFGPLANTLQYFPGGNLLSVSRYWQYVFQIIPLMLLAFAIGGLYAIRSISSWSKRFLQILIGVSFGEFVILLMFLLKKDFFLPRSIVLYSWILSIITVFLGRYLAYLVQKWLSRFEVGIIRLAIIGKVKDAEKVVSQMNQTSYSDIKLVFRDVNVNESDLISKIRDERIDHLIVINDNLDTDYLIKLRNICLEEHVAFSFVPNLFTSLPAIYEINTGGTFPLIEVMPTPLEGWGKVAKRLFDIVFSILGIIILSPIYVIIALWLKLTDPGPLIYRHERIGYKHQPIHIWKFRTFRYEYCTGKNYDGDAYFRSMLEKNPALKEEWEANHKFINDPRVTAVGHFLRASSLDELPQFFNVLAGSLSLVGPRPIITDEVRKYGEKARILFTVKPGVTGLWQVSGRNNTTYEERIQLDSDYIYHWNLWRDVKIIWLTFWQLVLHRGGENGAY